MLLALIAIVALSPVLLVVLLHILATRSRAPFVNKQNQPIPSFPWYHYILNWKKLQQRTKHNAERADENFKLLNTKIYMESLLPWMPIVHVSDQKEVVRIMLNHNDFPKFKNFSKYGKKFFGDNLVLISGEEWKKQRHVIEPAFSNIERFDASFHSKIQEYLDLYVKQMEETKSDVISVPVADDMQRMTLDVLGLTTFGYDFRNMEKKESKVVDAYNMAMTESNNVRRSLRFIDYLPTKKNKEYAEAIDTIDDLVYGLLKQSEEDYKTGKQKGTLLDMMINSSMQNAGSTNTETASQTLTRKEVRDNVVLFFIAGHETTSSALSFGLYYLAKHPHIQQKMREEVKQKIGNNPNPSYEQLQELEYMQAFMNEVLRLNPPVASTLPRVTGKDCQICGYNIPKGSFLLLSVYTIQRDPEIWGPDSNEFRPERFLEENSKAKMNKGYFPFLIGARRCLGERFSLLEQKLFYTNLLRQFEVLEETPLTIFNEAFIMQTSFDLRVKLKKYNN